MIAQRTKYALKALLVLADAADAAGGAKGLTIEEIARRSGAPKRFLEHILLELRNAGLVQSRRGRSGGYSLLRAPDAISLGQVVRLVDGPMAPLPCLSQTAYQPCPDCADEAACRIRRSFAQVYQAQLAAMEQMTFADMAKGDLSIND